MGLTVASDRIHVEGLTQLQRNIQLMTRNLRTRLLRSATIAGAKVVVKAAKARAPVRTGLLRKAIRNIRDKGLSRQDYEVQAVGVFKLAGAGTYGNTRQNRRKGRVGLKYDVDPPSFYWKFNELGTVKQPARPFIAPALASNIALVNTAIRAKLAQGLLKSYK